MEVTTLEKDEAPSSIAGLRRAEVDRKTLANQIADFLSWEIATRKIPPGARIKEVDVAKRFGVGRPLIREVVVRLELAGLLEKAAWRGAVVPRLTETQLSDLFEFSALVFGFTCRLAAERATAEQLSTLRTAVTKMAASAETDCTAEDYEKLRIQGYELLDGCLGESSELLERRPIVSRIRHQFSIDSVRTKAQRQMSARRWGMLLEYLESRDSVSAENLARQMTLASREAGIAALRAMNDVAR